MKLLVTSILFLLVTSNYLHAQTKSKSGYLGKKNLLTLNSTVSPNMGFLFGSAYFEGSYLNSNNLSFGVGWGRVLGKHVLVNFSFERKNSFTYGEYQLIRLDTMLLETPATKYYFNQNIYGIEFNLFPTFPSTQLAPTGWSMYGKIEWINGDSKAVNLFNNHELVIEEISTIRLSAGFRRTVIIKDFYFYSYGFNYGIIPENFEYQAFKTMDNYINWTIFHIHLSLGIIR